MKPRQLKIKAKVSSKTKFEKKLKRRDAPKRLKSSNKKDVNKHKHSQQINLVNWRLETDVAPDHMVCFILILNRIIIKTYFRMPMKMTITIRKVLILKKMMASI